MSRLHIQSGAKKKNATFSKSIFSYLYLSQYIILYIKLKTIGRNLWWWKLYQKYLIINILCVFKNDLQKTRVTKGAIFKENVDSNFQNGLMVIKKWPKQASKLGTKELTIFQSKTRLKKHVDLFVCRFLIFK